MVNDDWAKIITRIERDVLKTGDELYGAVTEKIPKENLADLISRSESLLKEYDESVTLLTGGKKESLLSFEFDVDQIREYLDIINN